MTVKRGEWVMCPSCLEESIYIAHDPLDHECSVCGCSAFVAVVERDEE